MLGILTLILSYLLSFSTKYQWFSKTHLVCNFNPQNLFSHVYDNGKISVFLYFVFGLIKDRIQDRLQRHLVKKFTRGWEKKHQGRKAINHSNFQGEKAEREKRMKKRESRTFWISAQKKLACSATEVGNVLHVEVVDEIQGNNEKNPQCRGEHDHIFDQYPKKKKEKEKLSFLS